MKKETIKTKKPPLPFNSKIEGENDQQNKKNSQLPQHLQAQSRGDHNLPKDWHFGKDHPQDFIIGETSKVVSTRNQLKTFNNLVFLSQIEPRNIVEAIKDES